MHKNKNYVPMIQQAIQLCIRITNILRMGSLAEKQLKPKVELCRKLYGRDSAGKTRLQWQPSPGAHQP
jgi:hypothetical protein